MPFPVLQARCIFGPALRSAPLKASRRVCRRDILAGMKFLVTLFLLIAASAFAEKKVVSPPGTAPGKPFSPAILSGGTLYVSGQVGADKKGTIPENFEDEVKQCFENIGETLKAGGFGFQDLVAVQVYLTDMDLFSRMNSVYTGVIPEPRPTRTTVGVVRLVGKARIEITVTARK